VCGVTAGLSNHDVCLNSFTLFGFKHKKKVCLYCNFSAVKIQLYIKFKNKNMHQFLHLLEQCSATFLTILAAKDPTV
jgi:hypothetical protein